MYDKKSCIPAFSADYSQKMRYLDGAGVAPVFGENNKKLIKADHFNSLWRSMYKILERSDRLIVCILCSVKFAYLRTQLNNQLDPVVVFSPIP